MLAVSGRACYRHVLFEIQKKTEQNKNSSSRFKSSNKKALKIEVLWNWCRSPSPAAPCVRAEPGTQEDPMLGSVPNAPSSTGPFPAAPAGALQDLGKLLASSRRAFNLRASLLASSLGNSSDDSFLPHRTGGGGFWR